MLLGEHLTKDLRSARGDRQKGSRRPRGLPASLLPFLECTGGHAQHLRKLRLRETRARARLRYGGHRNAMHPRALASLHLEYRTQQLFANVALSVASSEILFALLGHPLPRGFSSTP